MQNLPEILKFLTTQANLTESALARLTGIKQSVIHKITHKTTQNPKIETLSPIARYFGISISQLIGDEPLPQLTDFNQLKQQSWCKVPLLSFAQIVHWPAQKENIYYPKQILTDIGVSEHSFAIELQDSTMLPQFPKKTLCIIDPNLTPEDRDFVVAHAPSQPQALFKQLFIDGADRYLKPLSPEFKMIPLTTEHKIMGVMVQARIDFKNE